MGTISTEVVEQYGKIVPVSMEEAWKNEGALVTQDGFVRLIDPGLLLPVMEVILPSHPGAIPVFTTAWGDLVVQYDDTYVLALYRYGFYTEYSGIVTDLIFDDLEDHQSQLTRLQRQCYDDAVATLGEPAIDECFGFKLPLAMGGSEVVGNVVRRKLKEHLVFLVQSSGAPRDLDEVDPPEVPGPRGRVASGTGALTDEEKLLAVLGEQYLDMLQSGLEFGIERLPGERAVYVWQLGFGGAQMIVGHDESLLFGTSALGRDQMIETWRTGKRTPATDLALAAAQRRQQP
ncbi:T6SS immunity protein Tdi1 domain-containing protein [Micromonospora sp. CPCC 206060]|uniref:T6SS immunity protein Tdi1 domain-containing protein n=1 Tax=Micromonospora sp. CPCC 206060 TaxID=3122406 RepID=UPI002FF2FD09